MGVLTFILIMSALMYFFPTVTAIIRNHPSKMAIFVLNFFLGWTLLFWVISLVWALSAIYSRGVSVDNAGRWSNSGIAFGAARLPLNASVASGAERLSPNFCVGAESGVVRPRPKRSHFVAVAGILILIASYPCYRFYQSYHGRQEPQAYPRQRDESRRQQEIGAYSAQQANQDVIKREPDVQQDLTITFNLKRKTLNPVKLTFYSQSDLTRRWPAGGQAYILQDYDTHTYRLNCQVHENVCFGAWVLSYPSISYWGKGDDGKRPCTSCCFSCPANTDPIILDIREATTLGPNLHGHPRSDSANSAKP